MDLLSTTPFGQRMVSAGQLAAAQLAQAEAPIKSFDKWELFREICTARGAFGVTDRDLTVLNALLSFHPSPTLSDNDLMLVYPSNRVLGERAHGMAESTLRRHIAALVAAGLIARHDSPNGKRYACRDGSGDVTRAFGFSLRPLLVRAGDIVKAAKAARIAAEENRRLREHCVLMLRDAGKLAEYGTEEHPSERWKPLLERLIDAKRMLRRKMDAEALATLSVFAARLMADVQALLGMATPSETKETSGNDVNNERHYQNSNKDTPESEPALEKARGEGRPDNQAPHVGLPLPLVLKACSDIHHYAKGEIESWYDLIEAADFVRSMMGISPSAWADAKEVMGADQAAVVLAAMLDRMGEINSAGGYLRALTTKAAAGSFSPAPMVMALLNRGTGQAA